MDLQRRGLRGHALHASGGHESRTRQIPHKTPVVTVNAVPVTSAKLSSRVEPGWLQKRGCTSSLLLVQMEP